MVMQTAPELIFHDVDRSAWVETYILERVQRLERFADGHHFLPRHAHPGAGFAPQGQPLQRDGRDAHAAEPRPGGEEGEGDPRHAAAAAGADQPRLRRGRAPAEEDGAAAPRRGQEPRQRRQPHGIVEKLFDEGYGFLRELDDDRQVYFHRNSVLHDDFERLAVGTEVRFTPQEGDDGPQASSVQIVAKPGASP